MRFSVLASGSRANCTFVEAGGQRFLIDCGLSARQVEQRLRFIGIDPHSIQAILISHEHRDHIAGAGVVSKRWRVPVLATELCAQYLDDPFAVEVIKADHVVSLGPALIRPFGISHDAEDPVGFLVEAEGLRLAHVTDLGEVTPLVNASVSGCHALILESNHDEELLRKCWYPWPLKQRIASNHGHLSNRAAAALLAEVAHAGLSHIVLAHISENSNTPEMALTEARARLAGAEWPFSLSQALPGRPTELFAVAV